MLPVEMWAETERRRAPRYPFLARVEVADHRQAESRTEERTSDLSLLGCFVDTIHPLPIGAEVTIRIEHKAEILEALGMVVNSRPNRGMGIMFTEMDPTQQKRLENWIKEFQAER